MTAELLRFLAANTAGRAALGGHTPTGIIMSPACGLLGSHLFRGFYAAAATQAHLTCIEPEVQHQQLAKNAFKQIGIASNGFRFLPSHPRDGIGRLASTRYDLAIAECAVEAIEATVAATLPTSVRAAFFSCWARCWTAPRRRGAHRSPVHLRARPTNTSRAWPA